MRRLPQGAHLVLDPDLPPARGPAGLGRRRQPVCAACRHRCHHEEFCNACHGDSAPGASTNVVVGSVRRRPVGAVDGHGPGLNDGVVTEYQTASTFNAPLNGGGFVQAANLVDWETSATAAFKAVTSTHSMEQTGILWGAGNAVSADPGSDLHELPRSSRQLELPPAEGRRQRQHRWWLHPRRSFRTAWSSRLRPATPYADNGWLKHEAGQVQMADYLPNYTSGSSQIRCRHRRRLALGMVLRMPRAVRRADERVRLRSVRGGGADLNGAAPGGPTRHRHPVDITLAAGRRHPPGRGSGRRLTWIARSRSRSTRAPASMRQNQVGCLTCHFAHGSNAQMSGWAAAHLEHQRRRHLGSGAGHASQASILTRPTCSRSVLRPNTPIAGTQRTAAYRQPRRVRALPRQVGNAARRCRVDTGMHDKERGPGHPARGPSFRRGMARPLLVI